LRHAWRSGETITQFNIIMPIVTCEIPAVSKDGVELDIPRSAWNDVEKIVREEFGISLDVAFSEVRDEIEETPSSKYVLRAALNIEQVDALIDRLDPLIQDVIERHAQVPVISA
jgi:enolase